MSCSFSAIALCFSGREAISVVFVGVFSWCWLDLRLFLFLVSLLVSFSAIDS